MRFAKTFSVLAATLLLTTGGHAASTSPGAGKMPPVSQIMLASAGQAQNADWIAPSAMRVSKVNVIVPKTLSVSEENRLYPVADIVWRGEAFGDRRGQIRDIFKTAFTHGTKGFQGRQRVVLDVQVTRFHSLSERARYTVGGVHNMEFYLTVRDARTGAKVLPTRHVALELKAHGGQAAIDAERRGETQKVRVVSYLAHKIEQELRKRPVAAGKKANARRVEPSN